MKVLLIPDVHLKPWMFDDAEKIMKNISVDQAVCLGDLLDDWNCEHSLDLYQKTLDAAREFSHEHQDTFWCYGNHDVAYLWDVFCSGTSHDPKVRHIAKEGLLNLYMESGHHGFVMKIDHVIFSHAGISDHFVKEHSDMSRDKKTDAVILQINQMKPEDLWQNDSPLCLRAQEDVTGYHVKMYHPFKYFQAVGHTPVKTITQEKNLLTCDVFSTFRDHTPYGSREFCILDTETWKWKGIRVKQ